MTTVLWLLAVQGAIGAFDTMYYHEWKARLPARGRKAAAELKLHAGRDFLYGVLFATLPLIAWHGTWVVLLGAVIVAEIGLTLWDFVVEIDVRKDLGDVYAGERITHAIMGILYGAMIITLFPLLVDWYGQPTGFVYAPPDIPEPLRWTLLVMAAGVVASGMRDLYAGLELPYGGWPWTDKNPTENQG